MRAQLFCVLRTLRHRWRSVSAPSRVVELKNPRGRTVATAELTVSLSCLGAAGASFQLNSPAAAASSQPPGTLSTATDPPCCAPGVARNNPPPAQSPKPGLSVDAAEGETERKSAVAPGRRGTFAFTGDRSDKMPPPRGGDGHQFGSQEACDSSSWTCEFDPRDGSLTEVVATSRVHGVTGTVGAAAALQTTEHARGKPGSGGKDVDSAGGRAEGAPSKRERGYGRASEDDEHKPDAATDEYLDSSGSAGSFVPAIASAAAAGAAMTPPAAKETVDLEQVSSAPSMTPISAAIDSEPGRVTPPLPASEGEAGDFGGADTVVVETREAAIVGALDAADGVATEEAPRVSVVLERKPAGRVVLPGGSFYATMRAFGRWTSGRSIKTKESESVRRNSGPTLLLWLSRPPLPPTPDFRER